MRLECFDFPEIFMREAFAPWRPPTREAGQVYEQRRARNDTLPRRLVRAIAPPDKNITSFPWRAMALSRSYGAEESGDGMA